MVKEEEKKAKKREFSSLAKIKKNLILSRE